MELITAHRAELQTAATQEIARRNAIREERKRLRAEEKAHKLATQPPEESSSLPPRLDADELGRALLENLGFQ
jgi:hypothetical protein